jgi:hypothetical protein
VGQTISSLKTRQTEEEEGEQSWMILKSQKWKNGKLLEIRQ